MPPRATLPPTPSRSSARVALLVAGIWAVAALPVLLGLSRCPVATFLHTPCPGCGMTRALELLGHGEVGASLAMHPLAVPTLLVQMLFALVTVLVSLRHGTPFVLWRTRSGRFAVHAAALVLALDLLLWAARAMGLMHGPVPV